MITNKDQALMFIQDHIFNGCKTEVHDGFAYAHDRDGLVYYYDWSTDELICDTYLADEN